MVKGTSEFRLGGPDDLLVQEIMKQKGLSEIPQFSRTSEKAKKFNVFEIFQKWAAYTPRLLWPPARHGRHRLGVDRVGGK